MISVAVCDTPAGKYQYYGDVKNKVVLGMEFFLFIFHLREMDVSICFALSALFKSGLNGYTGWNNPYIKTGICN